ncbi:hypothetical protein [Parafrankia elaeagni]|uniref:hypothetical protein n=1 Tax=Parafrankia elaeagni TaxID=222534 RepID=UPI00036C1F40|nr:hypothetical protein [Parafrankia elaeagni]
MRELLERIEARWVRAGQEVERLREQISGLREQLAAAERTRERLEITRETVLELAGADTGEDSGGGPAPLPAGYREVLAVVARSGDGLHVKQVCQVLETGTEPRDLQSVRTRLKRLVERGILIEPEAGLFVLPRPDPPTPKINPV